MFGGDTKHSPVGWVLIGILFAGSAGGFGLPFVLKAAASGALGKAGQVMFEWILESSTRPEDLELHRQLALQRQDELERQSEFERKQAELDALHKRAVQEIEAQRRLKEADERSREAEHRRKLEEQAQIPKAAIDEKRAAHEREVEIKRMEQLDIRNLLPSRNTARAPVYVPQGSCVLLDGRYICNHNGNGSDPYQGNDFQPLDNGVQTPR